MEQESSNYLASDSTFNVPIILSTDGLESFTNSSITGTDDNPLNEEVNEMHTLENDINQNLEDSNIHQTINLDITEVDNSSKSYEEENKTYQIQNLKVNNIYSKWF
jgi:hypothetical protein